MKRASSSFNALRKKKKIDESTQRKNQSINYSKEINIDNYYPNQYSSNNKNYGINPNDYKAKYSNQLKRKEMFKELWDKQINENKNLLLLDSIKVRSKKTQNYYNNIIGNLKGVMKEKRLVSAGTFCNIPIKGKEKIQNTKLKSSINKSTLTKNNVRNLSSKLNINSDVNTITKTNSYYFLSNVKDKDKDKYSNEYSTIFHNQEIQNSILSPKSFDKQSEVINSSNNNINNKIETEKNDSDNINKYLANSNIINNYEKNPEVIKLRTEYLIKFSKIYDLLKKLPQITDCFRVNFRELYNASVKSLIRIFDFCNNFLLNEIKIGDNLDTNFLAAIYLNAYNFCIKNLKIQKFFVDELYYLKNENLNLKQKLNFQENELNQKNKEINEINKLINKYDLNSTVKIGKKLEFNVGKIKQKFTNQESSYILTIYKLEEEIKNLTELLKTAKPELNTREKIKEKYKVLDKQYEEEMARFTRINIEKDTNLKLLQQRNSTLNEKINELENQIAKYKENEEKEQENNIYCKAKIENLSKIIEKNKETIESLKKENENYQKMNNKENINVKTTKLIFMSPK